MNGSNSNTHIHCSKIKKKILSWTDCALHKFKNAMDLPFVDSSTVFFLMLPWNLNFFLFTRLRQAD